jgi:DNA polymerase-1
LDPEEVYYTNSILCRPPGNKFPGIAGLQCCHDRLVSEVELVNPSKILTVGGIGLTAALGESRIRPITRWRGRGFYTLWNGKPIYTVATYHPAAVLRDPDLFRDFTGDIQKFSAGWAAFPEPEIITTVPETEAQLLVALDEHVALAGTGYLSCDLETTGVDYWKDDIISIGFGALVPGRTPYSPPMGASLIVSSDLLGSARSLQAMREVYLGHTFPGTLAFHNTKFDLQFLNMLFQEFLRPPRITDSMHLHYCLDERPIGRFLVHGLKSMARVHYDHEDYDFNFDHYYKQDDATKEKLKPQLYEYQGKDTYFTARLCVDLTEEVKQESEKFLPLVERLLMPATIAFTEIEMRGIKIDIPYLEALRTKVQTEIADKLKELQDTTGNGKFNPQSHTQVRDLVYKTWGMAPAKVTGDVSGSRAKSKDTTNRTVLHAMSVTAKDPAVKKGLTDIVDFRQRVKVLKTYIDGILKRVEVDGRIHSDFRIIGTATGRISSSDPNLQNIPQLLGKEVRYAFIPSKGFTWVEADYAQLELRVAAAFSKDPQLTQTFKDGKDIHREVAAVMFSKPEDEVDDFDRDLAKRADFGILYGRTAKALVEGSEFEFLPPGKHWWTLQEAEIFLRKFLDGFPALRDYIELVKDQAIQKKYVESPPDVGIPWIRRRRFPFIPAGYGPVNGIKRQAFNAPIQGTASDICLTAVIDLHEFFRQVYPDDAFVLFSVHDAIYCEVATHRLKEILPRMERIMVDAGKKVISNTEVPFGIKLKAGPRWGEAKEVHTTDFSEGDVTSAGMGYPRSLRPK